MRRIILYIALLFMVGLTACKQDLANRFNNPDLLGSQTTDIVPGLFTNTLTNNKLYIQDYGEWYYLLANGTSITGYEQICNRYISTRYSWFADYNDLTTGNGFDDSPISGQGYFEQSYTRLKNLPAAQEVTNLRTGQAKTDANMYVMLLRLTKLYQCGKLVDFFNSIPYFNAFNGDAGGSTNWYPVYDDPKTVYESIITELGGLADSLSINYNAMSDTGRQILTAQDVAWKGDMDKWTRFANATRLKMLVRLAGVDPDFAKPLITATLAKPLPIVDLTWPMWYNTDMKSGGGLWMRGLYENSYASFIPNILMKRMNHGTPAYEPGIDDPRLPVIAMPTKYGDYRAISYNIDSMTIIYNAGNIYYPYADDLPLSFSENSFSMYNFATIMRNDNMPVYMFSLAELDLLLAEIELKGLASTGEAAEDHIKDAVIHSTNYWYALNAASNFKTNADAQGAAAPLYPTKPSDADIATYGDTVKNRFLAAAGLEDKMEILMQQKFIHLNILHPYECWAELRRTGHPFLEPFTWLGTKMTPFPERVRYPVEEQTDNPTNFAKVFQDNNMTSKIFWVPAGRNPDPYWPDYNYQ
jgi:hypothetical protein